MTKPRIWVVLGVVLLLGALAFALVWRPELDAVAEGAAPEASGDQIARGYELAQLGNCESCHTAEAGAPYAGGLPLETPFGTIHSVNITPDRETGIGTWSADAFARSMREGVDREGGYLYPAFPYTHFTRMTDEDIGALYAYLRSIPAVRSEAPKNDLPFPFNIRALMAGWNLLFLDDGPLETVEDRGEDWNRGRYLVEGVSHCGACHTPRNILGAEKGSARLAGAEIEGWYAPPLTGEGARSWTEAQMTAYLTTGFSRAHGAAAGPMGETVVNLSQVPEADIAAISTYVASLTEDTGAEPAFVDNEVPEDLRAAHTLWTGACAECHARTDAVKRGRINPSYGLPLAGGSALRSDRPLNAVRTIANGIDAYRDTGGPYMPAFRDMLTPDQIGDMARYVRARFSDEAPWDGVAEAVDKAMGDKAKGDAK